MRELANVAITLSVYAVVFTTLRPPAYRGGGQEMTIRNSLQNVQGIQIQNLAIPDE